MSRAFTTLVAESEKRNRAKTIIAASVGLDPLDQSAVISQLHQTGVGGRPAIVEATRQQMVEWAEAGRIHQVNSAVFQLHRS